MDNKKKVLTYYMNGPLEIPLPPLPAAQDRDPDAMKDTRPPKLATPPPTTEKTELEFMLEKHANNIPPGKFLRFIEKYYD